MSRWVNYSQDALGKSLVYFPVVGLVVAVLGILGFSVFSLIFSVELSLLFTLLLVVLSTGAFHEDGLADSCDGFGGGYEPDKVLTIMKDSRVGTYGALGLWFLMTLKFLILAELTTQSFLLFVKAFLAGHVLARFSSLILIFRYPYVGKSSTSSKPIAESLSKKGFITGTLVTFLIALLVLQEMLILPLSLAAVSVWIAGRYFLKRIGGITGDALGAANQLVEVSVYIGVQLQINMLIIGSTLWKFF